MNSVQALLLLSISPVVIGTILAILVLRCRWPAQLKTVAIIALSLSYFIQYLAAQQLFGWPSKQTPPQQFQLLAEHIVEPNQHTREQGAIYLWGLADGQTTPRAWKLPYSQEQHQQLDGQRQARQQGRALTATRQGPPSSTNGASGGSAGGSAGETGLYRIEINRARPLPEKR